MDDHQSGPTLREIIQMFAVLICIGLIIGGSTAIAIVVIERIML